MSRGYCEQTRFDVKSYAIHLGWPSVSSSFFVLWLISWLMLIAKLLTQELNFYTYIRIETPRMRMNWKWELMN